MPIGPLGAPAFIVVDETVLSVLPRMFELATDEWKALLDWCRFHGLDPARMPACQVIERDLKHRRVVYDEYIADADEIQHRAKHWRLYDGEPEIRRTFRQGETPPMPFPDVILRHLEIPNAFHPETA